MQKITIDARAFKYLEYADAIGQGEVVSRSQMAERFGVSYSTAVYHLELAVERGVLNKAIGIIGLQVGWVYAQPETMPRLDGMA